MTEGSPKFDLSYLGIPVPPLPESLIPIVSPDLAAMPESEYAWAQLKHGLRDQITALEPSLATTGLKIVEPPPQIEADLAVACHEMARTLRQDPVQIAQDLSAGLNTAPKLLELRQTFAQGGFLNFLLDMTTVGSQVLAEIETYQERYGEQNIGHGQTVVIDCSSPNVAKFMSVGHLRSTIIGESLARIYRATGHTVIRDNHLGDWGTQFGMLGKAYELWANDYAELRDNTDPVRGLYKLYVRIHEEVEQERAAERSRLGDPEADVETPLEREGRRWFQKLEAGDEEALKLLNWATKQSLAEFQKVYNLLGSNYEYMLGESFYIPMLPAVLQHLRERGIAAVNNTGATIVDLSTRNLPQLVVQKSDATSLYATRDLATLVARTAWFNPKRILYVVGEDQREYFRQVFATFDMMTEGSGPRTEHIHFGMIRLPEGKISTRAGRVIFLEDLLNEAISRARQKTSDPSRDLSEEERESIARQVGVGAVVFFDLGQGRERNIVFNWDQALSLDGRSAPYIQYAQVRTRALLRRAQQEGVELRPDWPITLHDPTETALVKHLGRFPEAVSLAGATNSPHIVAEHNYRTAALFSDLYRKLPIFNEPDALLRNGRLRLTQATSHVIRNGLNLLCIEAPERM